MVDLKNIPGVSPDHADRYGQQFISLARQYSDEKDRNMSGADAASPPPQPAGKAQSSYFKTKDWDVVEIGSSDEESPSTNDDDGFIDDEGDDEYGEDWNEEGFEAASGYFDGATQSQAGTSTKRSKAAKKLTGNQLAWRMEFESQATQAAAPRAAPATGLSNLGAKKAPGGRASGGRGGRGGKKYFAERRSSGKAGAAGGGRNKGAAGVGKSKASGGNSRSAGGGGGVGTGARNGGGGTRGGGGGRGEGGGGAIRPMAAFFPR